MSSDFAGSSHATQTLERFRALVMQDERLQRVLRDETDEARFVRRLVELGTECGCEFAAADVEAALRAEWLAWLQRRVMS